MAEKEKVQGQMFKRNIHSYRGHPGQSRLYNQLGVKDLRELLDRKRGERSYNDEASTPPPDPSDNYLNDPISENETNSSPGQQTTRANNTRKFHTKNNACDNFKRDKSMSKGSPPNLSKSKGRGKDIENPVNIKVEFSTYTGEHVYKIDETTILPTIKHIPDTLPFQNPSRKGRIRGRGKRTYQTRTIRSNNLDRTTKNSFSVNKGSAENPPISYDVEDNWDNELNANKSDVTENEGKELDNDAHEERQLGDEYVQNDLQTGVQSLTLEEGKLQNNSAFDDTHTEKKN